MPTNTHTNSLARRFTSTLLARLPRPDTSATEAIRQWALAQGHRLDPAQVDAVTLHYQFWEGQWYGQVVERMPLPEAVIRNWQGESDNNLLGALFHSPWGGHLPTEPLTIVDRLPHVHDPLSLENTGNYHVFNGLYRRAAGGTYGPAQRVGFRPRPFRPLSRRWTFTRPTPARSRHSGPNT
ncbi:dermonecrotic toxin domain-containing protein [Pseudomonas sp. KNUC1026]|uniref:dermonecrotic toxin domain-containing protein n=1 Tax=Pseudomonas sp. KNUC1026 TaxID=2893890 RepID=UPI001F46612E|nr:DUF6543 domain-containing protein [Pseudomonas sp. KNUC1026]UFH48115.1 hypothetical protein LN139_12935 [Pseudomonas sp. KNUC1026]